MSRVIKGDHETTFTPSLTMGVFNTGFDNITSTNFSVFKLIGHFRYSNMAPRLSGQTSIFSVLCIQVCFGN